MQYQSICLNQDILLLRLSFERVVNDELNSIHLNYLILIEHEILEAKIQTILLFHITINS
jgi:hypothetical protein